MQESDPKYSILNSERTVKYEVRTAFCSSTSLSLGWLSTMHRRRAKWYRPLGCVSTSKPSGEVLKRERRGGRKKRSEGEERVGG